MSGLLVDLLSLLPGWSTSQVEDKDFRKAERNWALRNKDLVLLFVEAGPRVTEKQFRSKSSWGQKELIVFPAVPWNVSEERRAELSARGRS